MIPWSSGCLRDTWGVVLCFRNWIQPCGNVRQDMEDPNGAIARFFDRHVIKLAMDAFINLKEKFLSPEIQYGLKAYLKLVTDSPERNKEVGSRFYTTMFEKYPEIMEYFAETDVDHVSAHLVNALIVLTTGGAEMHNILLTVGRSLSAVHRNAMIPQLSYSVVGMHLFAAMDGLVRMDDDLTHAWQWIYAHAALLIMRPIAVEERRLHEAQLVFKQFAKELGWTDTEYNARITRMKWEVQNTGMATRNTLPKRGRWQNGPLGLRARLFEDQQPPPPPRRCPTNALSNKHFRSDRFFLGTDSLSTGFGYRTRDLNGVSNEPPVCGLTSMRV